jgi:hypothetical protein
MIRELLKSDSMPEAENWNGSIIIGTKSLSPFPLRVRWRSASCIVERMPIESGAFDYYITHAETLVDNVSSLHQLRIFHALYCPINVSDDSTP